MNIFFKSFPFQIFSFLVEVKYWNSALQITEEESLYQSRSAPIPYIPTFEESLTPLHRLYTRVLNSSDPKLD